MRSNRRINIMLVLLVGLSIVCAGMPYLTDDGDDTSGGISDTQPPVVDPTATPTPRVPVVYENDNYTGIELYPSTGSVRPRVIDNSRSIDTYSWSGHCVYLTLGPNNSYIENDFGVLNNAVGCAFAQMGAEGVFAGTLEYTTPEGAGSIESSEGFILSSSGLELIGNNFPSEVKYSGFVKGNSRGDLIGSAFFFSQEGEYLYNTHNKLFVRNAAGALTWLELPSEKNAHVTDINADGSIVGYFASPVDGRWQAFLRTPQGVMTILGQPEGFISTIAEKINDSGQILLTSYDDQNRAVVLNPDGNWTAVGFDGNYNPEMFSLNNHGEVLGQVRRPRVCPVGQTDCGEEVVPFIFKDGQATDLRTLVPIPLGFVISEVISMNDYGDVLASLCNYDYAECRPVAFLKKNVAMQAPIDPGSPGDLQPVPGLAVPAADSGPVSVGDQINFVPLPQAPAGKGIAQNTIDNELRALPVGNIDSGGKRKTKAEKKKNKKAKKKSQKR